MAWERGRFGGVVARISVGCLLGAGTLVATAVIISPAANATCASHHVNVEGNDAYYANSFGNKGYEYVNTAAVINSLHDDISRSFFVFTALGDDVEVGWFAHDTVGGHTYTQPTVFAEWINRGVDGGTRPYTGYTLNTNGDYRFRVENIGNNDIWRFVVDGESSPFNYSPTMQFNYGWALTNSEHYNSCDSLYSHQYNLSYASSPGYWVSGYNDLQCYSDNSTDWYFQKLSNSELEVNQTSSTCNPFPPPSGTNAARYR